MALRDLVQGTGIVAGALTVLLSPLAVGNYWSNHNEVSQGSDRVSFSKMDGVMAHTDLSFSSRLFKPDSVSLHRSSFFDYYTYQDTDEDGRVDIISNLGGINVSGKNLSGTFFRFSDYFSFPELFNRADKEFQEQLARFQPLMDDFYSTNS